MDTLFIVVFAGIYIWLSGIKMMKSVIVTIRQKLAKDKVSYNVML